jgi:DNA-dependent RNA polymerase auxiliary subunit epsilon
MERIKRDPMEMYHSRKTAKVVKPTNVRTEWQEQLAFCKWLKMQYPDVRFRSDIQSAGKLSPAMQNIKSIIDPFRGFPDITIYLKRGRFCGLMLEMKRLNSGLYLKDGSLSNSKHVQEQNEMHEFLRDNAWKVEFAEGMDGAKIKFEEYLMK